MYKQTGTLMKFRKRMLAQTEPMKAWIIVCLIALCCNAFAQTQAPKHFALTIPLKNNYTLVFLKKEQKTNLYQQPRILIGKAVKKIIGYDDDNFSSSQIKSSPGGSYLTMENIIKGYAHSSQTDSVLHENYGCVIIDLKKSEVVHYLQSDCDGNWNKNNEWISNGTAVYQANHVNNTDQHLPKLSKENVVCWLSNLSQTQTKDPGSKLVLREFPATWPLSGYHKEKAMADSNTIYVDSLNYLLHQTLNSPNRTYFHADKSLREKIIPLQFYKNFNYQIRAFLALS